MKTSRYLAVLTTAVLAGVCSSGRGNNGQAVKGEFPWRRAIHIESPDRRWLIGSKCTINCPPGEDKDWDKAAVPARLSDPKNELFIENASTHGKRPIAFDGYSGNAVWSPDSTAFFINSHIASDETDSGLHFADPLKRIDVDEAIRHSDPAAVRFFEGHRYFIALRWLDDRIALVRFCGHPDEVPVLQFDFLYRVGSDGSAQRISRRITRPSLGRSDCK